MPINNLNNIHFSEKERVQIMADIKNLAQRLSEKLVNLSAEERKKYGSVNEQNKLLINKVHHYHNTHPELSSPDVDWDEFKRDYDSRQFLESILSRFQTIATGITNAKTLHDWDNYQDALTDYGYAQYKLGTAATDYEDKVNEIKQFFNRSSTASNPNPEPTLVEENQTTQ